MKIRMDYVTNSSSSAFVIFGIDCEKYDIGFDPKDLTEEQEEKLISKYDKSASKYSWYDINKTREEKLCYININFGAEDLFGMIYDTDLCYKEDTYVGKYVGMGGYQILELDTNGKTVQEYIADVINKQFNINIKPEDVKYIAEALTEY